MSTASRPNLTHGCEDDKIYCITTVSNSNSKRASAKKK